jgi:pyruvate dehydrogenase E1 component alpha subunit/2-oxoisovalerate dehydrogenase E1 component alpha subunit
VELVTYRRKGHAEHDNQSYVPAAELEAWAAKDPIDAWLRRLTENRWATPAELADLDTRVARELDEALATCLDEPFPDPSTALTGVCADPPSAPVEWYRTLPGTGPADRLPATERSSGGQQPDPSATKSFRA